MISPFKMCLEHGHFLKFSWYNIHPIQHYWLYEFLFLVSFPSSMGCHYSADTMVSSNTNQIIQLPYAKILIASHNRLAMMQNLYYYLTLGYFSVFLQHWTSHILVLTLIKKAFPPKRCSYSTWWEILPFNMTLLLLIPPGLHWKVVCLLH